MWSLIEFLALFVCGVVLGLLWRMKSRERISSENPPGSSEGRPDAD